MSTSEYPPEWLELREGADAAARSAELVDLLITYLPDPPLVIRDLGCGTGSMGRWLGPRLPGPQRWILHDRDPGLLARAAASVDGGAVTAVPGDVTGLRAADLAGTSLVTASALLDLLTADEVAGLAAACTEAGCPALLALSVAGHVEFTPADPLDAEIAAAFDDHQRRTIDAVPGPAGSPPPAHAGLACRPARSVPRRLLGPDAAGIAAAAFELRGATVYRRPSPWWLGPERAALIAEWLRGWVAAAIEQRPDLALAAETYLGRRLDACAAGRLRVMIGHDDLLALPGGAA